MMCMQRFNCMLKKLNQAPSMHTSVLFVNLFNRCKLKFNSQLSDALKSLSQQSASLCTQRTTFSLNLNSYLLTVSWCSTWNDTLGICMEIYIAHKINSLHVVPAKMSRYVYVVIPLNHCMLYAFSWRPDTWFVEFLPWYSPGWYRPCKFGIHL